MKKITFLISCLLLFVTACTQEQQIRYATKHFELTLSVDGQVRGFTDLRTGVNYANAGDADFCVLRLHKDDTGVTSDKVTKNGNILTFSFPGTPVTAKLRVKEEKSFLVFDIDEISGGDYYALQFAHVPLTIDYQKDDFAACAMSRHMNTRTLDFPGKSNLLGGQCFSALGVNGAGVFLLGMPETMMRETMKQVVDSYAPGEMPVSRAGGPYAMDDPRNYGSYIITSEPITEDQVDEWVAHLSRFGINQVYFHQGTPFSQGDFQFNKTAYPNGVSDFRKMSEAFRRHGFVTGLLTYAQFLPANSSYLTPVPHRGLDALRTFTLAADLNTVEQAIPVVESTMEVSDVTGYLIRNSKVLRIDDELIIFGKPSHETPYGFTSCERGAYGTKVSAHSKGAQVQQLTQFFNYFVASKDSELYLELARESARAYNEGGFDMLYLDAFDATWAIVDDPELTWYYEALFVNEILKYTATPPSLEASGLSSNLWYSISRNGTWDSSVRGHKRFFDMHIESNLYSSDRLYLPGQIGWTALCPSRGDNVEHYQYHILFPEDAEYYGAKMLAYNYSPSYLDIQEKRLQPLTIRTGAILKNYDVLRRDGYFPDETLQRLRDPDAHFLLHKSGDDWRLIAANYAHVLLRPDVREFSYRNPYQEQTPMIRIEHRHQPAPYESSQGIDLLPFDEKQPVQQEVVRTFEKHVDLSKHLGIGLWVYGDGGGQRITIHMESPLEMLSGFIDRFIFVDFTGWRYFAMAEADNGLADDTPPCPMHPCDWVYEEFKFPIHFSNISKVSLQIKGNADNLRFRTLRALPLTTTFLVDPALETNGQQIIFRGKIKNGHFMEYLPESGRATVYDAVGNEVSEMQPVTSSFKLAAGYRTFRFTGNTESGNPAGVRITLRTQE